MRHLVRRALALELARGGANMLANSRFQSTYALTEERYAQLGVHTDAALSRLA